MTGRHAPQSQRPFNGRAFNDGETQLVRSSGHELSDRGWGRLGDRQRYMILHPEARGPSPRPPYFLEQALKDYWYERKKADERASIHESAVKIISGALEIWDGLNKGWKFPDLASGFTNLVEGVGKISGIVQEKGIGDNQLANASIRVIRNFTYLNDILTGNPIRAAGGIIGVYEARFESGSVLHEIKDVLRVAEGIQGTRNNQGGLQGIIEGARDILKITGEAETAERVGGLVFPKKRLQRGVRKIMDSIKMLSQQHEETSHLWLEIASGNRSPEECFKELEPLCHQTTELNKEMLEHANKILEDMRQEIYVRQLAHSVIDTCYQIDDVIGIIGNKEDHFSEDNWNRPQKVFDLFKQLESLNKRQEVATVAMQLYPDKQWDALMWLSIEQGRTAEWLDTQ